MLGEKMSVRIDTLVRDMISSSEKQGEITLSEPVYEALMQLRAWLFRNVYTPALAGEREGRRRRSRALRVLPRAWPGACHERPGPDNRDCGLRGRHDRPICPRYVQEALPAAGEIFA